jgi:hypothetical protein
MAVILACQWRQPYNSSGSRHDDLFVYCSPMALKLRRSPDFDFCTSNRRPLKVVIRFKLSDECVSSRRPSISPFIRRDTMAI